MSKGDSVCVHETVGNIHNRTMTGMSFLRMDRNIPLNTCCSSFDRQNKYPAMQMNSPLLKVTMMILAHSDVMSVDTPCAKMNAAVTITTHGKRMWHVNSFTLSPAKCLAIIMRSTREMISSIMMQIIMLATGRPNLKQM